jgi:hypothetical protein
LGAAGGNSFRPGRGCFSHGSEDCHISSYFLRTSVESWYEECRNSAVDKLTRGTCKADLAMASFERASSKPGRGSCCLLEGYGTCFREGGKEGDDG